MDYAQIVDRIKQTYTEDTPAPRFRSASEADLAYLHEIGMPESLTDFYKDHEPDTCIEVTGVRMITIADMRVENEDAVPGYVIYPWGYRVFGSTEFGDAYVFNTNVKNPNGEYPVLIASHDEIEEDCTQQQAETGMFSVAQSFPEFLRLFAEGKLRSDIYDYWEEFGHPPDREG